MNDATHNDDLRFFQERGFGKDMGFGDKPALLVVDIMRAFTDATLPLGANLDVQVEQINRLLDAAHQADMPVFFSIVAYDEADCRDAGVWSRKMSGLMGLTAGSKQVELDPRLRRRPGDSVFVKKYASCFFGTDLASRLQSRRIDTLIVTGCTTSGCVRASAVDAVQYGFRPIVPREAVGDRSRAAHDQSLFDLQAKYGDVMSVDGVLAKLRSRVA
ncbi:MAG TPA: isochorismatase family protein [Alphaproteobacteria bacterium]